MERAYKVPRGIKFPKASPLMCEAYWAGLSAKQVAEVWGLDSIDCARRMLKHAGVVLRTGYARRPAAPQDTVDGYVAKRATQEKAQKPLAAPPGIEHPGNRRRASGGSVPVEKRGYLANSTNRSAARDAVVRAAIADAYRNGAAAKQVITDFHIGQETLYRILEEYDVATRKPGSRFYPAKLKEQLAASYRNGLSLEELAAASGYRKGTVKMLLLSQGVTVRHRVWFRQFCTYFLFGEPLGLLAERHSLNVDVAWNFLREKGMDEAIIRSVTLHVLHSLGDAGFSLRAAATACGLTRKTVLTRLGADSVKQDRFPEAGTGESEGRPRAWAAQVLSPVIVARHEDGQSVRRLAEQCGVPERRLRRLLLDATRGNSQQKKPPAALPGTEPGS